MDKKNLLVIGIIVLLTAVLLTVAILTRPRSRFLGRTRC